MTSAAPSSASLDETVRIEGIGDTVIVQGEKLAQLEQDAGREAMQDLIVMYLGEAERLIASLLEGDESVSAKEKSRWAHSLKSSSASFGARAVEVTAAVIEKSYKNGDVVKAAIFVRQLPALEQIDAARLFRARIEPSNNNPVLCIAE